MVVFGPVKNTAPSSLADPLASAKRAGNTLRGLSWKLVVVSMYRAESAETGSVDREVTPVSAGVTSPESPLHIAFDSLPDKPDGRPLVSVEEIG